MKLTYTFFLFPLILLSNINGFSQFIEGESYICHRTTETILIDGKPEESSWVNAKWTSEFVDIEGGKKPLPYLQTKVKMLWDDEFFYFFAKLDEPHIWANLKQRDTVIYWDNDFELFIDPNGDTHNYYELELNALNTVWDLLLTKPYRDGGKALTSLDIAGLKTSVYIEGTLNNPADTDTYWSVEVAIPWKTLKETLPKFDRKIEGKTIRVNYSRVQWETDVINGKYVKKPLSENNWVWSPQRAIAMHEPEFWGRVYFSPNSVETNDEHKFDKESEKVRQALYSIHRAQRSRLKKLGSFSNKKNEIFTSSLWDIESNMEWTLTAETHWYHIKLQDPFNKNLVWHIDETGRLWKEKKEY